MVARFIAEQAVRMSDRVMRCLGLLCSQDPMDAAAQRDREMCIREQSGQALEGSLQIQTQPLYIKVQNRPDNSSFPRTENNHPSRGNSHLRRNVAHQAVVDVHRTQELHPHPVKPRPVI